MVGEYRIAGNFRGVQIFAVFADRQGTAKIKTTKFLTHRVSRDVVYVRTRGVVRQAHPTKIKTTKISSGGSGGISAKMCTHENFPLYGTCQHDKVIRSLRP